MAGDRACGWNTKEAWPILTISGVMYSAAMACKWGRWGIRNVKLALQL